MSGDFTDTSGTDLDITTEADAYETAPLHDTFLQPAEGAYEMVEIDQYGVTTTHVDTDSDGVADYSNIDADGDGSSEMIYMDSDGDGRQETVGIDTNGNGWLDRAESDVDGDGVPDGVVTDTDEDGLVDVLEIDEDGDGVPDYTFTDTDYDGTLESFTAAVPVDPADGTAVAGPYAAA
ncbi:MULTISPECIES: hypothetical protein [Catenuloplanes]|uniref:Uncharacterized protein n=1 Tax=Catenuloplanes niger TaxID=587534 RepID=A0AAE3ZVC7_9ACTN|nr:hypothetical protein [Catenuloplanes niger]MDR7324615.1 hypothetical protein [Catenuloplanes niger]